MLKNDPKLLIQILDDYSSGVTNSLEVLAKRNGLAVRTLFMWLRDKNITLNYMGRENITFGQAMQMARNVMKAVTVGRTLEDYVLNGRKIEVWHHGSPQFLVSEELARLGENFVLNVLGLPDMYERDANGNRIIMTRVEYAPAQLIEKYASANMPHVYGNKSEVTMKGNVSLGVSRIGERPPLPAEVQAMIEPIMETALIAPSPAIGPGTDTEPEQYEVEPEPEPVEIVAPPEPERVIRDIPPKDFIKPATPKPVGYSEIPLRQPRNELERDLFDKLRQAREKAQS